MPKLGEDPVLRNLLSELSSANTLTRAELVMAKNRAKELLQESSGNGVSDTERGRTALEHLASEFGFQLPYSEEEKRYEQEREFDRNIGSISDEKKKRQGISAWFRHGPNKEGD